MAIKIFVDQGHNPSGPNTGAEGSGLLEQDVTYAVGVYLADLLRADPRFEVRLSRSTPEEILGLAGHSCRSLIVSVLQISPCYPKGKRELRG